MNLSHRPLPLMLRLAFLLPIVSGAPARAEGVHQLKSAFIFNFAKYIGFPSDVLPDGKPFTIGIEGEDDYSADIVAALTGKLVGGHPFLVRRVKSQTEMRHCQFLVVGESSGPEMRRVIREVQGASVVLIGDGPDFARVGGTIGFVEIDNHVRFDVNLEAAKVAGLTISSKMLGLAVTIYR